MNGNGVFSRLYTAISRRLRNRDLLEQVWHERDDTEVDSIRERIKRLMVLEESMQRASSNLEAAGLIEEAQVEKAKAELLHNRILALIAKKRQLELRIVQQQARYYREGTR